MRKAGSVDWQIRIDTPVDLLAALYVRDAAGLRPAAPPLPSLSPAVDPVPIDADLRATASAQWTPWWLALVRSTGSTALIHRMPPAERRGALLDAKAAVVHALDGWPELAAVIDACGPAATGYADARLREITGPAPGARWRDGPIRAVAAAEEELGRPVRAFCLTIEEMPLAEAGVWPIGEQRFVTSVSFPDDRARLHAWLTTAVLAVG
jgi:hypothetical protein